MARRTPRSRAGRPTKLNPQVQNAIVAAVRAGSYWEDAAVRAGVHPATVRRWRAEAEADDAPQYLQEFRDAVARAQADARVRMVAAVMKDAAGGQVVRRVTRKLTDGTVETEEQYSAPNGRVALEYLSRADPERWARRQALEVSGPGGGPIAVQQPDTAALAARLHTMLRGQVAAGELKPIAGDVLDD
jgi:hypothetical protein